MTHHKTVLLTGSTGYLGSFVLKKLIADGLSVVCLIRNTSKPNGDHHLSAHQITYISDENSPEILAEHFKTKNISAIIHLATYFVPEHAPQDIKLLIISNLEFGMRILEAASLAGIKKILNIGTFWQHYQGLPYSPTSLYAATKRAFEDILQYYCEIENFSAINLKFAAIYGPSDPREKIINLLLRAEKEQQTLMMSPGEQLLDLIYIDDAVQAILHGLTILQSNASRKMQSYSVSSQNLIQLRELVHVIEKTNHIKIPIHWGAKPYRKREFFKNWVFDPALPEWSPTISLEDGIRNLRG